ncbi:P-loop containing nucleoside triphosphate hydrolase [Pseudocohnilembus persalinus]|uniref:Kinesin-like protein n=1 Tax=Pseudocohnilembus persalinus TaxID=266149 RepID=A0A0V0QJU4_PSEPJ|nr:P-loop containing nucleoside triphosphate hydrolase [Pseudocohnilembus persalinus]|eukprot:KRX02482.1 P-loop containing nucleoside triphosphate hydrolase [Pseudocohnilembus persalinus]
MNVFSFYYNKSKQQQVIRKICDCQQLAQGSMYQSNYVQSMHQESKDGDNCKVIIRVRPPLPREIDDGRFISTIQVAPDNTKICVYEYFNLELVDPSMLQEYLNNPNSYTMHQFSFDHVYDQDSTQEEVYENTAKQSVLSTLQGYNSTIMAYGQTGTGKTFTMEGFKYNSLDPSRGIIPRAIEEIFKFIENSSSEQTTFMVRASYLQIYNEVISDLLRTDRTGLQVREDKKRGIYVEGLSEWAVRNPTEIFSLIQKGAQSRATASTKMNDVSSRSHAVFIIIVEQMTILADNTIVTQSIQFQQEQPKEIKVGKLNLVDLAGSERVRVTGATGKRLEECKKINQSLSCLGNVISALTDSRSPHIPYRDSKLTRILEDSLGGNCKTTMFAMISPALEAFQESLSSLKFANRAKNIKCKPIINEDVDQRALLIKYEQELRKLKQELKNKTKTGIDKTKLTQLEEDRRRAEQDKNMAMAALEARSKEFFQERELKRKLEEKIRSINSQLLVGGHQILEHPEFRNALEQQQVKIREEYENKIKKLEQEREQIEEDKAQVDRYKQLLLKQRDIMIALTTRLNERDETIIQLQEELDAYDRIHRETEEMLESKSYRVAQLQEILKQNKIPIPQLEKNHQSSKENSDSVNCPGMETYNITNENLQVSRKQSSADSQQSNMNNNNKNYEQYEQNIANLKENLLQQEQKQVSLLNQLQNQELEMQENQIKQQNEREKINQYNYQIRNSVDNIIGALSQPNDPQKLQNVAKDLLNLQKVLGFKNFEQQQFFQLEYLNE